MRKKCIPALLDTRATVILWANWFQFAPAERIMNPCVSSRMLLWCEEGKGRVRVNGVWHAMEANDFLFLPWKHEICYVADDRAPFRVAGIHVIPNHPPGRKLNFSVSHHHKDLWAGSKWRQDVAWPGLAGVPAGRARASDPLRLLGAYIVGRFEAGYGFLEGPLRQLSQLLVAEIARTVAKKNRAPAGNEVVRRAQEFAESHLGKKVSLHALARLAGCSVSTLRRQFQQTFGIPPYEWILQARIRKAQELLSTTTLRIQEVAGRVGFDDAFQFSRTFRQRTGSSPRQFRKTRAFAPK